MAKMKSGPPMPGGMDMGLSIEFGALPIHMIDDKISPRLMRDARVTAIDFVQPLVQRVLWENAPSGTGLAKTLIQYERPSGGFEPRGFVGFAEPASNYLEFVEVGTQPHFAPVEPLMLWGARKFGDPRVGWFVRYSIARKGTKAQWFVRRTQETLIPPVSRMMIDKITEYLNSPTARLRNLLGL